MKDIFNSSDPQRRITLQVRPKSLTTFLPVTAPVPRMLAQLRGNTLLNIVALEVTGVKTGASLPAHRVRSR